MKRTRNKRSALMAKHLIDSNLSYQRGGALLIIMTALVVIMTSVFVSQLDSHQQSLAQDTRSLSALSRAKKVLVQFALISDHIAGTVGPGYLPCPDLSGDGLSDAPCGQLGESVEGWLPWQTLGIQSLKDSTATCLRYAVSGNYKHSPASPLSAAPPTAGHFIIHDANNMIRLGNTASDYAIAIVFAAGKIQNGQSRALGGGSATTCGSSNNNAAKNLASNYLETLSGVNNATGTYSGSGTAGKQALPTDQVSVFIQAQAENNFNDQLIWISPSDFADVYRRMP